MSFLYRAELIDQQKTLSAQLKNAQDKAKMTGDTVWADEAATLQLSLRGAVKKQPLFTFPIFTHRIPDAIRCTQPPCSFLMKLPYSPTT